MSLDQLYRRQRFKPIPWLFDEGAVGSVPGGLVSPSLQLFHNLIPTLSRRRRSSTLLITLRGITSFVATCISHNQTPVRSVSPTHRLSRPASRRFNVSSIDCETKTTVQNKSRSGGQISKPTPTQKKDRQLRCTPVGDRRDSETLSNIPI